MKIQIYITDFTVDKRNNIVQAFLDDGCIIQQVIEKENIPFCDGRTRDVCSLKIQTPDEPFNKPWEVIR
jgi:hypothetical protein